MLSPDNGGLIRFDSGPTRIMVSKSHGNDDARRRVMAWIAEGRIPFDAETRLLLADL